MVSEQFRAYRSTLRDAQRQLLERFQIVDMARKVVGVGSVGKGQRMMQAASDIYLGRTTAPDRSRHFYWRQLRDMKGSAEVGSMTPVALTFYARTCGWTLARAQPARETRSPSPRASATATRLV